MPAADAPRVFTGIARTYDRAAAVLSFGQDPRWRATLVSSIKARPGEVVLDVATGTGLVAAELRRRYGCRVVGLDQSADMLAAAHERDGVFSALVRGRAERLPFADASFDHLTFTYLLRYVDDPATTMRELARVVRPGGRVAMLEFAVPRGIWRPLWWLYTRIGLPLAGSFVSRRWRAVGAFLGPSIERFARAHPHSALARDWHAAGLDGIEVRVLSLGGGIVMRATKGPTPRADALALGSAFYSLAPGGIRDYWTLLHPPYTAWLLANALAGAAIAPAPDPRIVAGGLLAFALAVGVSAHAFDELRGRPLNTRIPTPTLVALGTVALAAAVALGIAAVPLVGPAFLAFVAAGAALVLLYAFETPVVHSDPGFALAWGAFPTLTLAFATGAAPLPTAAVACGTAFLSLAQRRLSTRVRAIRRRAVAVSGEIRYRDGSRETLDGPGLIAAPEAGLRLLWPAIVLLSLGVLLGRWT